MAKTYSEILSAEFDLSDPHEAISKIHEQAAQKYADQQTSQLREELEAAKKDNEEFKREFTEAMDDVARLGGENEKLQKEIERVKLILKNCVSCGYYSNWETFKSNHNL